MLKQLIKKLKRKVHYRYRRFYINMRYFIQGPVFKAYSYTLFLIFCLLLSYIFYNRVLKDRLPLDINDPVSNIQLGIYIYILLINITLLVILLATKFKEKYGDTANSGYISKFSERVGFLFVTKILKPISNTYIALIYKVVPVIHDKFFVALFIFFQDLPLKVQQSYFYGMLIIPKLIVLICFLTDVFIFEIFYFFYKTLWLLLLH